MQTRMQTVRMQVSGLGVSGTVRGVRSALECIRGVEDVRIAVNEPFITVTFDAYTVRPAQIETAVRVMGCKVEHIATPRLHQPSLETSMLAGFRLAG